MRLRPLALAAGSALALFLAVVGVLRVTGATFIQEADLPGSPVYEINHGFDGRFYVSGDDDLWQIDPSAGMAYNRFQGLDTVVDAKPDLQGYVWWTDFGQKLNRMNLTTRSRQSWFVASGFDFLGGLSFDRDGNIWLPTSIGDKVFRFRPSDGQLCRYTLPTDVESIYAFVDGENIWLANSTDILIIRFNPSTLEVTSWSAGPDVGQLLQGPVVGWDGKVWWSELTDIIGSLDPNTGELRRYQLPSGTGGSIELVDPRGDQVWYTEDLSGTLGILTPAAATYVSSTVTPVSDTATAGSCTFPTPSAEITPTLSTGSLSWSPAVTTTLVENSGGWTIYQLDEQAEPYGLDAGDGYQWATDQGRQKVLRLPISGRDGLLKVTVSPNPSQAFHGQVVTYTYSVTYRSGDDSPAQDISLADDLCSPISARTGGDENGNNLLEVYETWTYTCQYDVPGHFEGEAKTFTNTATVSGKDIDGQAVQFTVPGSATVTLRHPLGTLSVTNSGPSTAAHGQKVTFNYTVGYSSPDGLPAQAVSLADDLCSTPAFIGGDTNGDDWLDVSETWSYRCQTTIPAHAEDEASPLVNTATATGQNYDGTALIAKKATHATNIQHALGTLKLNISGPTSAKHGQTVLFGYNLTYISADGASAKAILLKDDACTKLNFVGGDADGNNRLGVDENWLYSCSYVIPDHVEGEADPLVNKATATGQNFNGQALAPVTAQHATNILEKLYLPVIQR